MSLRGVWGGKMKLCLSIAWNSGNNMHSVQIVWKHEEIAYVQNYAQKFFNTSTPYLEIFLMLQNAWPTDSHTCSVCLLKWMDLLTYLLPGAESLLRS
jgi:hypothetical protein